ncbi:hypothetical protein CTEN210_03966 [Chaetoceros tenuissimus]|uniref:RING-type domain-containing protein n=1 Tax=Chaetoceros tenuissimus TaxID=426638 RepID=A0AAD3H242_9STRA|nr:hypothetical protein CTEN210_03966 [Chaetoceros tenuissimus]
MSVRSEEVQTIIYLLLGFGLVVVSIYCCMCKKHRDRNEAAQSTLRHRDAIRNSVDRIIELRRQLVLLLLRKEQLTRELGVLVNLQRIHVTNEIIGIDQDIVRIRAQIAQEEENRLNPNETHTNMSTNGGNNSLRRNMRSQRMSEGIHALSERLNNVSARRDETANMLSIPQNLGQEELREKILLNIIHKKVITKENISSSSDDIDEEAPRNKDDIILSTTTCGDEEDGSTLISSSIQNMCAICCENYEEGDDIAYSRNQECHHFYHVECILEWLMRDNNDDCPLCRSAFLVD